MPAEIVDVEEIRAAEIGEGAENATTKDTKGVLHAVEASNDVW